MPPGRQCRRSQQRSSRPQPGTFFVASEQPSSAPLCPAQTAPGGVFCFWLEAGGEWPTCARVCKQFTHQQSRFFTRFMSANASSSSDTLFCKRATSCAAWSFAPRNSSASFSALSLCCLTRAEYCSSLRRSSRTLASSLWARDNDEQIFFSCSFKPSNSFRRPGKPSVRAWLRRRKR